MTDLVDGRYRLLEVMGSGGMAAVWRAFDIRLEREVALKRPHPMADTDPRRERLIREARLAASVSHPNLVTVHDVGADSQGLYLVMELVEAPSLADVGRQLSPEQVRTLGAEVAQALAAVHARGIVHRDVKPANILLSPRGVKLTDFGIALDADPGSRLTEPGMVMATANYAAPEVLAGHPATPAGDIYSLGVVLRELLGRPAGAGLDELLDRATSTDLWRRPDAQTMATGLLAGPQSPVAASAFAAVARSGSTTTTDGGTGPAPTLAMPSTRTHVVPSALPVRSGTDGVDTSFNRHPPFKPEPPSRPDPDGPGPSPPSSSLPIVAVVAAVAGLALIGLLVIQLFSNAMGRVGDSFESARDLVDGADVTVPSTGESTEAPTTTTTEPTTTLPPSTAQSEGQTDPDGGGFGSFFDFDNPLDELEQGLSDAVEAGEEARDTAREFKEILKKVDEAVKSAESDNLPKAADKLNEAAERIEDRLDGDQREQTMALLEMVAGDLGLTMNDEGRFELDPE